MGIPNIKPIENERFKVKTEPSQSQVTVRFTGDIDMADPGKILDPFFETLHQETVKNGVPKVVVDFKGLTFLNSSGIKAIATWIMNLSSSDTKYEVTILQNKDVTWQTTSLPTLTYLLPDHVTVQ